MEKEVVTVTIPKSTWDYLNWKNNTDLERSKFRAKATRKVIEFWDKVKKYRKWSPITSLNPSTNNEKRWIRRNLYTFEIAGLIKIHKKGKGLKCLYFKAIWPK